MTATEWLITGLGVAALAALTLGALAELYRWLMERRRRRIAEYMAGPYLLKREEALQRDRAKFRDARLS